MKRIILAAAMLWTGAASAASLYAIGNSLTWDSSPFGVAQLAQSAGQPTSVGYHVKAGKALNYITSHPTETDIVSGHGPYQTALTSGSWDNIMVQPFQGAGSTMATDMAAFSSILSTSASTSPNAKLYLYAAWPGIPSGTYQAPASDSYHTAWTAPSTNSPSTPTSQTGQYFDNLHSNLVAAHPTESIYMIPAGSVFDRIDQEISAGNLAGFDSALDFYRDPLHMRTSLGRYVAAATVFSTVFGLPTEGLNLPGVFTLEDGSLSLLASDAALKQQLDQIVWDVVSHDSRTGLVPVPLPAAAWLMLVGLGAVGAVARKRKAA
jgi:hypothetical protein